MNHGTNAGYSRHIAAGERPCPACVEARTDYNRLRRAETQQRMQLPVELIARLYLAVPIALQEAIEAYLSPKVVDVLVQRLDAAGDIVDAEVVDEGAAA